MAQVRQQVGPRQHARRLGIPGRIDLGHSLLHKCHLVCAGAGGQHGRAARLRHASRAQARQGVKPVLQFFVTLVSLRARITLCGCQKDEVLDPVG